MIKVHVILVTFKNHMRHIIVHIVATDRVAEHPTCAQHMNCTLRNTNKNSVGGERDYPQVI